MSALTSLLARDKRVPVRKIEEAIQRQVIVGGAIETVLLEMGVVGEDTLAAYSAAVVGLLSASRAEVMSAATSVIRMLPRDVAVRLRMVPLAHEANVLRVAVANPVPSSELAELEFLLGVSIVQRLVVEPRLEAALAANYGVEIAARYERLAEALKEKDPGEIPRVSPPEVALSADGLEDDSGHFPVHRPSIEVGRLHAVTSPPARPSSQSQLRSPKSELLRKQRGPLTTKRAVELLQQAAERDEVTEILSVFAEQFFDFVLVAAVRDERAEVIAGTEASAVGKEFDLPEGASLQAAAFPWGELAQRFLRASSAQSAWLPVVLRGRAILYVIGDRAHEGFSVADIPEVQAVTGRAGEALLRIVAARKQRAPQPKAPAPRPIRPVTLRPMEGSLVPPAPLQPGFPLAEASLTLEPAVVSEQPPRKSLLPSKRQTFRALSIPPLGPEAAELVAPQAEPAVTTPEVSLPESEVSRPFNEEASDDQPQSLLPTPNIVSQEEEPPAQQDSESAVSQPESHPSSSEIEASESDSTVHAVLSLLGAPRAAPAAPARQRTAYHVSGVEETVLRRQETTTTRGAVLGRLSPARDRRLVPAASSPALVDPLVPTIIVETDDRVSTLVAELQSCTHRDVDLAVGLVVSQGEQALPILVRDFPGQLWIERKADPSDARDVSAVMRAMSAFGEMAVPYIDVLLKRERSDHRYFALLLAKSLPHADLVAPVARLIFDDDAGVASGAVRVLADFRDEGLRLDEVLNRLRSTSRTPRHSLAHRLSAIRALVALRDADSVPMLIRMLAAEDELATASREGLRILTRQDFGSSSDKWEQWFTDHGQQHRIEWLIDALMAADEESRRLAGEELKHVTQQYYGYHHALPRKDREVAQKKYRDWWRSRPVQ